MKYLQSFLYLLLVMTGIVTVFTLGPIVETRVWPVYNHFKIIEAVDTPEGLLLKTRFVKNRDCAPQGYGWFLGEFGILKQVITRSTDTIQLRPLGDQLGSFVVKELTRADLPYLYAEVYHYCHPLWTTRSVVYP